MKLFQLISVGFFFISVNTFGHGEMSTGPHGGEIKMPGAFHTELVLGDDDLKIYLLDINIENPMIKESSLEATFNGKPLVCTPSKDYFLCSLKGLNLIQTGQLVVKAKREKASGTANYQILKKEGKDSKSSNQHKMHH